MLRIFRHWGAGRLMKPDIDLPDVFSAFKADMLILASPALLTGVKCPACPFGKFAGRRAKTDSYVGVVPTCE